MREALFQELSTLTLGERKGISFFKHDVYLKEGYVGVPVMLGRENFCVTSERQAQLTKQLAEGKLYVTREVYDKFYEQGGQDGKK